MIVLFYLPKPCIIIPSHDQLTIEESTLDWQFASHNMVVVEGESRSQTNAT